MPVVQPGGTPLSVCCFTPSLKRKFSVSLLALSVVSAAGIKTGYTAESASAHPSDKTGDQALIVTADGSENAAAEAAGSYTVPATRAGTKLNLTQRDIPQSVSVVTQQRIKDQNLQNVGEALTSVTGISASQNDSERVDFYSRGFYINNYDDIPSTQTGAWNFGETDGDSAIYERIDVVRGSTGLMTGTGNPGAAINMIRKKADSKTFAGNLSASYGSWDNQRYVADLSGPLNESGTLRGRVVTGYQDQDSWVDRYHKRKKFLYATVAADITDNTTLDLGYDYQTRDTDGPTWGGLPTYEFSSALDPETEQRLFRNILELDTTVIAVTHRLGNIKRFDRIIVMADGQVIESGTFASLTASEGRFYRMWQAQFSSMMAEHT